MNRDGSGLLRFSLAAASVRFSFTRSANVSRPGSAGVDDGRVLEQPLVLRLDARRFEAEFGLQLFELAVEVVRDASINEPANGWHRGVEHDPHAERRADG